MKGLILHCKHFSFKDIANSTKPEGLLEAVKDRDLSKGDYTNKVVVMTCLENGDKDETLDQAARHVTHMIHEWHSGNSEVLVLPFGHLSKNIAKPPESKDLMDLFVHKLKENGNAVELITFGSHKEWMVDVYGYPRATSWFEF